jgi:hypothetical protein
MHGGAYLPVYDNMVIYCCNLWVVLRHTTVQNALLYQIIRFVIFVIK